MFSLITAIILASLLIPSGFDFLTQKEVDSSYAPPQVEVTGPQRLVNKSLGIKTTAQSILIIDKASGKILYDKNSQAVLPIASITKLMAMLVFLEHNPGWEQTVSLTKQDIKAGGFTYVFPEEQATVKDLFYLGLVASANEAIAALVRSTNLDNFTALMNQKAFALGMTKTYFADETGLDSNNVSTPADLVKLAQAAFSQPQIAEAVKMTNYEFSILNNQRQVKAENTDRLLTSFLNADSYKIIGAKTGYLDEAGYCLLLEVKKDDGESVILVLLGASDQASRWQEAKGLVDWFFANYQWPR